MSSPHHKPIVHIASTEEPGNHLNGSLLNLTTMCLTPTNIYAAGSGRYIFAVDRASGEKQHVYESQNSTIRNPLVVDDILYTTTTTEGMEDSRGIIEAWRLSDSAPLWHFSMPRLACYVYSPLVVAHRVLYASTTPGGIYALDALTGVFLWGYHTENDAQYHGSFFLKVHKHILYCGAASGAMHTTATLGTVFALDARDGRELWGYKVNTSSASGVPTVVDEVVYTGVSNDVVYALQAQDGSLLWRYQGISPIMGQVVVHDDSVYAGTRDNGVFALHTKNGKLRWHRYIDELVHQLPVVANRVFGVFVGATDEQAVYIGSYDGFVCALRRSDGSLLWLYETDGLVVIPIAASQGVVYVLSQAGYTNKSAIYALQADQGHLLWRTPIGLLDSVQYPSLGGNGRGGEIPITQSGTPAFIEQDIRNYFQQHPVLTTEQMPALIKNVLFLTSKEASVRMNQSSLGLPDRAIVCLVELQGPFILHGVSRPVGTQAPRVQHISYVLDAQTGRRILFHAR